MLQHLRRLLDPAIWLLIATNSLGLALADFAGLFGIPLVLILVSWFFKYAYALLDDVAYGVEQAPVLSVEMVNPVAQRPLAQLAICLGGWAVVLWTDGWLRGAFVALFAICLPASIAILGASGKFLQAANPLAWLTVMRALGGYYVAILALIGAGGLLGVLIAGLPLWLTLKLAVLQFLALAVFNAIGAALYERRDQLDLDVLRSPERSEEREQQERTRLRARMVDEIYAQVRARKFADIEPALTRWFDSTTREDLRVDAPEILRSALAWNDARALSIIAPLCIIRLHEARLVGEALDLWETMLDRDSGFRLAPAEKAAELAELSALAGRRSLARKLASSEGPVSAGQGASRS